MKWEKLGNVKIAEHQRRATAKLKNPKIKHPVALARFRQSQHKITENEDDETNRSAPAKRQVIPRQAKDKCKWPQDTYGSSKFKKWQLANLLN